MLGSGSVSHSGVSLPTGAQATSTTAVQWDLGGGFLWGSSVGEESVSVKALGVLCSFFWNVSPFESSLLNSL